VGSDVMARRAYIYFVLTFLIGVVLGGAGMYYYAWCVGKWHPPHNANTFVSHMTRDLRLSPQQVKGLRSIIDGDVKQFHAIQAQVRPQIIALHKQTRAAIRQILNSEQVKDFDSMVRAHREARKKNKK
jgi:hypothetical protein